MEPIEGSPLGHWALAMQRELGVEGTNLILAGEVYGDKHPQQADARGRYCKNLVARGLMDEAEAQARLLMAWREEHLEADDYKRRTGNVYLAEVLVERGQVDAADAMVAAIEAYTTGDNDIPPRVMPRVQRDVGRVRGKVDTARAGG